MTSAPTSTAAGAAGYKRNALALAQPLSVYFELTYRCNWRCVFCYNPRRFDHVPLSATEWIAVLDELRLLGTLTVTLTGGEPLAHPEFFEIAAAARERAFAVQVFTNGALIDETAADRLARLDPLFVELSLHGASATTHDAATATPGSFDAMMRGLDRLRRRRVRIQLKTPVTRLNVDELAAMVSLVRGLGVPYRVDPTLTPRDDGDRSPLAYAVSREGLEKTYRLLAEQGRLPNVQRQAGGSNCGLGRITMAIDPEGDVYPCLQWRKAPLTNVRRERLSAMWGGSEARREVARVATAANSALLAGDPALSRFPFCPALAQQRTGDPLGIDEGHRLQASVVDQIRLERSVTADAQ